MQINRLYYLQVKIQISTFWLLANLIVVSDLVGLCVARCWLFSLFWFGESYC